MGIVEYSPQDERTVVPFYGCEFAIVWTALARDGKSGGWFIATIFKNNRGLYVPGYQTDENLCVLFERHATTDYGDALRGSKEAVRMAAAG